MKFGAIIIGDEILSGKRQDKHLSKLIEALSSRGLELAWAQYLGDDTPLITSTLRRAMALPDVVFSFGALAPRRTIIRGSARQMRLAWA